MAKKEYGTRKKYHFIYKTTNLLSGRYYIGMHSTDDLNDGYLGSGTLLKRSLNKHGKENHSIEILEFLNSREELAAREKEIITLQEIAKKECMNLKVGGKGGTFSEQIRIRLSIATTELWKRSEHREKVRAAIQKNFEEGNIGIWNYIHSWQGKKHKPETIEKMCDTRKGTGKGVNNSQYGTCWITNEIENKKIKKSDPIPEGWRLGRKIKTTTVL